MYKKTVLAYCGTGPALSTGLAALVAERVEGAAVAPLSRALEYCPEGGLVIVLVAEREPLEGIKRGDEKNCRVFGPLPSRIVGSYAARVLTRNPLCREGWIIYGHTIRASERHDLNIVRAAYYASRLSGLPVNALSFEGPEPPPPPQAGSCAVVPSLLPGALPGALEGLGWTVVGRYILQDGRALEDIVSWIRGVLGGVARPLYLGPQRIRPDEALEP